MKGCLDGFHRTTGDGNMKKKKKKRSMNERDRILLYCSAGSKSLRCGQPDNVHPYAIHDNPNSEHSIMMKAIKRLFKIEPELVMNQMVMPCCNEFELLSMTVGRPRQTLEQRWRVDSDGNE